MLLTRQVRDVFGYRVIPPAREPRDILLKVPSFAITVQPGADLTIAGQPSRTPPRAPPDREVGYMRCIGRNDDVC